MTGRARRWALPAAGVALVAGLAALLGGRAGGASIVDDPVQRVLVVSLPGLSWSDVEDHDDLPNLEAFVRHAAVGDLSTRIGRRRASTTDAYLSLGAGTRALAPTVDVAVALDPDETYGGVRTADILERRLGRVPDGVAYLAAGAATELNQDGPFGGEPGRLGDLLDEAGVQRAVIANADAAEGFVSDEPPPDGAFARGAATMLMGSDGIVPGGTVARSLLVDDPDAPFGRRLDPPAVLAAFDEAWAGSARRVVLVEASDLSRAAAYGPRATPAQRSALRDDALARSDALLGRLLERVDPARDAVLVLSPVSAGSSPELAVVALSTPEVDGGVLRSSTTRRDGYVQLADVAPTVLRLVGEHEPDEIEGRSFEVSDRPTAGRVAELADEAAAAGFRDSLMPLVVPLVIGALAVLAAATWQRDRLPERAVRALRPAAHVALGVVPATFVASQVPAVVGSTPGYLVAVAVLAVAAGAATWAVDRRRPGLGPIAALGGIVAMFTVDVLLGAPLQVNAVFGYSVAVAGRFAGLGNLAFALFGAAAVLLAALLVDRYGVRCLPAVTGLLVAVVLLEGLPMLGADVGGVLSMVPAFGVCLLLLAGRRPSGRHALALVAAAGLTVLVFAFVDVARPSGQRTHLARLAEHLVDGRWSSFSDSLTRRLQASFGGAEVAAWALVLGLIVVVAAYVVLVGTGRLGPARATRPSAVPPWLTSRPALAAVAGAVVLAGLGLVANDSSIAVPATMLIVIAPIAVLQSQADPREVAA
ncbi:MAG TPA: hypothetical protein VFV32_11875 [Acidimicrobiales bacterium]|nr:hypothetical protein [Acidimicrobiales bacterium]